ncbi:MAG: hypothetical protein NSGCLCUN01_01894 [uncultured Clostridium sp.]
MTNLEVFEKQDKKKNASSLDVLEEKFYRLLFKIKDGV